MKTLYFLFGIHNHQPVGNFPEVFERAYRIAYKPFIELLYKHPKIKFNLHCCGILWEYLSDKHKEYIEIVKEMISRGQVELLTGGYYEPIISVLPDRDKFGQIKKLTDYIKSEFGFEPSGLWLAERIWEGHLPKILSSANIEYTVLDDNHFISSGIPEEELTGYYITEEQGCILKIFPINQKLRYYIPWKTVEETMNYLKIRATEPNTISLTMADDGEKYGLWPGTHKLVYEDGWLEKFLTALEKSSEWITTLTFSEFLKLFPAKDRVYLPSASYFEMSEWSLPQKSQEELQDVIKSIEKLENKEQISKFLRGSHWRSFLTKYYESNNMYKKMLYISNKIQQIIEQGKKIKKKSASLNHLITQSLNHLYAGQCNCAYWHGVFGGLYLPHLRSAIYKKLIEAETVIDKIQKSSKSKSKISVFDFDSDGDDEIIFESKEQNLYFSPHYGGSMFEWDIKPKGVNILNVLTRRKEAYHRKLKEIIKSQKSSITPNADEIKSIKTVAEVIGVKDETLHQYLHYDWYRRYSLIDHFIHPDTKYEDFKRCQYGEQGDFVLGKYNFKYEINKIAFWREGIVWVGDKPIKIKLEKVIVIQNNNLKVKYTITNLSGLSCIVFFAPEFNFAFSTQKPEDTINTKSNLWLRPDENLDLELKLNFSLPEPNLWSFPIETVSISEAGFEKTYQGTSLTAIWKTELNLNTTCEYTIDLSLI